VETPRGGFAALDALPAAGPAERQPALLLPGYTGSKEDFLPVLAPLAAAGRRVLAIDQRGQYETPAAASAEGYGLAALAADVAAIADALGEHQPGAVHLLGHSFGGLVARETLLSQAAGIRSLTLLSSGPAAPAGPRAVFLRGILAELEPVPAGHLAAEVRRLWDTQLGPAAAADGVPPEIIGFLRTRMLRNCPTGLRSMAQGLLSCPDRTPDLAALDAPTLVVYGEDDDEWAPQVQDEMAYRLGAERICIPGAAHSPAVEAPATVASTLTGFWNSVEASARRH
jgi:pimeloyl-ACP methyl ester carboxylesterase